MRLVNGSVVFDSKMEIENLQNLVENGIYCTCSIDEEREAGKAFSMILEEMLRGENKVCVK